MAASRWRVQRSASYQGFIRIPSGWELAKARVARAMQQPTRVSMAFQSVPVEE
jgi:hypothetical protein